MNRLLVRCVAGVCIAAGPLGSSVGFVAQPPQPPPQKRPLNGNETASLKALQGGDAAAREKTLDALLTVIQLHPDFVPVLKTLADDASLSTRVKAALLLCQSDPKTDLDWELVRAAVKSDDAKLPQLAVEQLARQTRRSIESGLPVLLEAAAHADARVAARAFNMVSWAPQLRYDALVKGLEHDDPAVRRVVLRALTIYPQLRGKSLPLARAQLNSPHGTVKVEATRAVWRMTLDPKAVLPTLREVIGGRDEAASRDAFTVLLPIVPAPEEATDLYKLGLRSPDLGLAVLSAQRLLEVGGWEATVPGILRRGLKDATHQASSFSAIGKMGARAKDLLPDLIVAAEKVSPSNAGPAAAAFQAVGADAVPELIQMIELAPKKFDPLAVQLIGGIGEPAVKPVAEMLPKVLPELRLVLLRALGQTRSAAAVPALTPHLAPDKSLGERQVTLRAIERLGFRGREAGPAVRRCFRDEDEGVRLAAVETYVQIFPSAVAVRDALVEALKDPAPRVWLLAAEHLLWVDPRPELLAAAFENLPKQEMLSHPFWFRYSRLSATEFLGLLELSLRATKDTPSSNDVLLLVAAHRAALKGKLDPHREAIRKALEAFRKDTDLNDEMRAVRPAVVAKVAMALGEGEEEAIRGLVTALKGSEAEGDTAPLVELLGEFGPMAKAALPLIEPRVSQLNEHSVNAGVDVAHVAVCRIDPARKAATLAKMPLNEHTFSGRLTIDPKDEATLNAVGKWLEAGEPSPPLYSRLPALEPPPAALRPSLEKAIELFGKLPPDKSVDPFRLVAAGPPDYYRLHAAYALWKITGDTKKTLPVLSDALKRGVVAPWQVYDVAAKIGPEARELVAELLRYEVGQPHPTLDQFRTIYRIDRATAMKVNLTK